MVIRPSIPEVSSSPPLVSWKIRIFAIIEVLLAFVFVHITFRSIKQFTELGKWDVESGFNFTPGLVMILFTLGVLTLFRRDFFVYGLICAGGKEGFKVGLLGGLLLILGVGILMLLRVHYQPGSAFPSMKEGIAYGLACLVGVGLFAWMVKRQQGILSRVPFGICLALFGVILCLPIVFAWYYERPLGHTIFTVMWLIIGAGIGEELFYRGYIQSRINEVFGRPFRLWGIRFGLGLILSTLLFGFLHTLNSVDYFQGRFTFAWGFGILAIGTGLLFGCLRERTGSIVASAVTHSILDVLARIPTLIS